MAGPLTTGRTRERALVGVGGFCDPLSTYSTFAAETATIAPGTGFCGAFTTFSTFAVETVRLAEDGDLRPATVNAVETLLGALLAVALDVWLTGAVS